MIQMSDTYTIAILIGIVVGASMIMDLEGTIEAFKSVWDAISEMIKEFNRI